MLVHTAGAAAGPAAVLAAALAAASVAAAAARAPAAAAAAAEGWAGAGGLQRRPAEALGKVSARVGPRTCTFTCVGGYWESIAGTLATMHASIHTHACTHTHTHETRTHACTCTYPQTCQRHLMKYVHGQPEFPTPHDLGGAVRSCVLGLGGLCKKRSMHLLRQSAGWFGQGRCACCACANLWVACRVGPGTGWVG